MRSGFKEDIVNAIAAFIGTKEARDLHAYYLAAGDTVESGLDAIQARWPALKSPSDAEPIFILAAGWRTGSTFLQRILMSADDVFIWGEPYRHADVVNSMASQVAVFNHRWPVQQSFLDRFASSDLTGQWIANLYPNMDDFIAAHVSYFERLLAAPAQQFNASRWGMKEIALTTGHARYLKWLFPRAKFLFLYRNPYHAWRSYHRWRTFYKTWPNKPVFTPMQFGGVWKELTADFIERHEKVGGLLLRYEDLKTKETKRRIEDYLGCRVVEPSSLDRVAGGNPDARRWAPKLDYSLLGRKVRPLAAQLGYKSP